MSANAASIAIPCFNINTRTQSFCNTKSPTADSVRFSVNCVSTGIRSKPTVVSSTCGSFLTSDNRLCYQNKKPSLFFRFVRAVAVSSDVEQDSDFFSDEEEDQPYFTPDCKLFVGNLPFDVDSSQLADLFGKAGNVEMVEVIYDKTTGRSRGFGFVTMSNAEEVEAVVKEFNGYELEGRPLRVNSGPPPPKRNDAPSRGGRFGDAGGGRYGDDSSRGGGRYGDTLSRGGRYGDAPSRGGRYGDAPSRGERYGDGHSRGGGRYGDDHSRGGRYGDTSSRGGRYGDSSSRGDSGNRLYVGNLAWSVDNETLGNLFSDVGNVLDAQVIYDRDSGRSKGFGFVTLSSAESVNKAIESLDGVDVDGREIRVSPAEARPKRQY